MGARVLLTGGGTGGHLYPALNLAEALRRLEPEVELLYVGARRGVEARVLPEREIPHRLLPVHPIHRRRPWRNWRLVAGAPSALAGARRAGRELDPDVVVGTGGYASGPALLWALAARRPVALQEQNARPGLVTRALARWAEQVHLGFPEARERLRPGSGTQVFTFGNPVAPPGGEPEDPYPWPDGRVLLVVGGSQGAAGLNRRLLRDLQGCRAWPADLSVVWVAGPDHHGEVAERVRELPWSDHVRVEPFIPDLGRQLGRVSLALARAGAMFVSELAAAGVPAVLVPYPAAAGGHQRDNARALASAGAAVVREEAGLTEGQLWALASHILADDDRRSRMARAARRRGAPDAAREIAREVLRLARRRRVGAGRSATAGGGRAGTDAGPAAGDGAAAGDGPAAEGGRRRPPATGGADDR